MRAVPLTDQPGAEVLALDVPGLRDWLWRVLPTRPASSEHAHHETAWALAERFDAAGLPAQAALCRSVTTHEVLSVWRWTRSFPEVSAAFWEPALETLGPEPAPPARVRHSLASARGLLEAVGEGLRLTPAGTLPRATVFALDDRFRWTEDFPWLHPDGEADIPPLHALHEHLVAQGLLSRDGDRLVVSEDGRAARDDLPRLWRAVVDPRPRWSRDFEQDALGVTAAVLLRRRAFSPGRTAEEVADVLAAKWRPAEPATTPLGVYDGVSAVVHAWYLVGVPLGWWDTGHGPADRRPNAFGRAAAEAVFRAMRRAGTASARAGGPPP